MNLKHARLMTVIFLGLIVLAMVIYDLIVIELFGVDASISVMLNEWGFQAHPLLVFGLGSVAGGLIVHFFRWKPKNYSD